MLGLVWIGRILEGPEESVLSRISIWKMVVFGPLKQRIGK